MSSGMLTCVTHVSLGFMVAAVGFHLTGFLTQYWLTGSSDNEKDMITEITIGLWKQNVVYRNGTGVESDSLLNIREEHYIMLAEAGTNFLLCFVVLFKPIHVCVGIIAFINITLMLLSSFYSFVHTEAAKGDLQELFLDWPNLSLSWSFYFVWLGLLVNVISTGAFLTALLIKGERKASKSSKGLGPEPTVPEVVVHETDGGKVVRISTIANDNYAYNGDTADINKSSYHANSGTSFPGSSHEPHERAEPMLESNRFESREKDNIVTPDDIEVPSFEEDEPVEPYYIGRVNTDDAENMEFGYGDFDLEVPESAENQFGTSPNNAEDDDEIIETSRL